MSGEEKKQLLEKLTPAVVEQTSVESNVLTVHDEIALSPTKQANYSHKRHLESLRESVEYFRTSYEEIRAKHDIASPQLAAYKQAAKSSTLVTAMVAVFVTVGAGLMSAAGMADPGLVRQSLLASGWVLTVGGLFVQVLGNVFGWPSD